MRKGILALLFLPLTTLATNSTNISPFNVNPLMTVQGYVLDAGETGTHQTVGGHETVVRSNYTCAQGYHPYAYTSIRTADWHESAIWDITGIAAETHMALSPAYEIHVTNLFEYPPGHSGYTWVALTWVIYCFNVTPSSSWF